MADVRISQLAAVQVVNDTSVLPMTANGATVKVSAKQLKEYVTDDYIHLDGETVKFGEG